MKLQRKKPDWDTAQALFFQGVGHREICKEVGCSESALCKQVSRGKWTELRRKALELRGQNVALASVRDLTAKSDKIRRLLADDSELSAAALREIPLSPNLRHLDQRTSIQSKLAGTSEKLFGWREENQNGAVNLAFLTINIADLPRATGAEASAVIDVEPEFPGTQTATNPPTGTASLEPADTTE